MKMLISGSSGHLGEALGALLADQGHQLVGVDILPGKYTTDVGSITDATLIDRLMVDVDYVLHTATLHKPHVATHTQQDFIDMNIAGTLNLLRAAAAQAVKGFIFTSTTSTFGDAMRPAPDEPAVWVTEEVIPRPKNIYGVTKTAAEDLCQLYSRNHSLPCLVLRTSRFFMEVDDNKDVRDVYDDLNVKANEFLYRRVDTLDAAKAHLHAIERVRDIGFSKYIISATTPFSPEHLSLLNQNPHSVLTSLYPEYEDIYRRHQWTMFSNISRVYVNDKARRELGWEPTYNFEHILQCVQAGGSFYSPLALQIGVKGYHPHATFTDGPYPVAE